MSLAIKLFIKEHSNKELKMELVNCFSQIGKSIQATSKMENIKVKANIKKNLEACINLFNLLI